MFEILKSQGCKPVNQAVAASSIKRGAPIEGGRCLVDVLKSYDGFDAVVDPMWTQSDTISAGSRYNKIVTEVGEKYATSELILGSLVAEDGIKESSGKFVKAAGGEASMWKYKGLRSVPYGVTMYEIERVPSYTVTLVFEVSTASLADAQASVAYTDVTLAASYNGTETVTWVATGLPTGMTLSSAGVLSGTPSAGTDADSPYSVVVTATAGTNTATKTYSLVVAAA